MIFKEVCLTAEALLLEALGLVDLLLLLRLGFDVLESAGDGLWDWGRGGEVSTLGLESCGQKNTCFIACSK